MSVPTKTSCHLSYRSLFLNLEIAALTLLSQLVHLFLPGKLPLEFHLCSGTDPAENGDLTRKNIPLVLIFLTSIIVNNYVPIRVRHYQLKYDKKDRDRSYSFNLSDLTTTLTMIVCTSLATIPMFVQYTFAPIKLNLKPYNLIVFSFQMLIPRGVAFFILVMYYIRNKTLRVNIWRSLKETLEN